MLELRKSADRGVGKPDWLDARFTFSFGPYKDPNQIGFSDLRLLNDDQVKAGGSFATHEHKDTEELFLLLTLWLVEVKSGLRGCQVAVAYVRIAVRHKSVIR